MSVSEKPESLTPVIFRMWHGDDYNFPRWEKPELIALFPTIPGVQNRLCSSYQHMGGHGDADYRHIIRTSRPATPEEYAALKSELESDPYGYEFKVYQRYQYQFTLDRRAELDRIRS